MDFPEPERPLTMRKLKEEALLASLVRLDKICEALLRFALFVLPY